MNEEYSVNENSQMIPEHQYYSEFNDSSRIGEHEQYSVEDQYVPKEFQRYDNSGYSSGLLSRHSSVLRKSRNRLGRLLALLSSVAVPAAIIIVTLISSIFVEVKNYTAETESLKVTLNLHSTSENTEFNAVLTDRDGNIAGEAQVDPAEPVLTFTGLTPGELYYLEVFADGESKLKLNYILPEEENTLPTPEDTTEGPGSPATPDDTTAGPGTPDDTGHSGGTPTPPSDTLTPAPSDVPTDIPTDTPTVPPSDTPTAAVPTDLPTNEPTDVPTGTPTATPTDVPTATASAAPSPTVTVTGERNTFNSASLILAIANIDPSDIRVSFGGATVQLTPSDDGKTLTVEASGLTPNTPYIYTVLDKSGKMLLTGTITTNSRTSAQIEATSYTSDLTWAKAVFRLTNPDGNTISAKLDGNNCTYSLSGSTITCEFNDLAEGSSHVLTFYDWDGSTILTYPFSTRSRTHATVSVTSQTIGYDSATIRFSITNPDGNTLKVRYDGSVIQSSLTSNTYTLNRSNLVSGETHKVEFIDSDGSVIFTHTFSARSRTPATVSFNQVTAGFNSATVKMNVSANPDGNTLELRLNGSRITADFSSSTPSTSLTGLQPRTTYTVTVYDSSCGQNVAQTSVTTVSSVTWTQNAAGDAIFTLTDPFYELYPNATMYLTDSYGYNVYAASTATKTFTAAANDLVYSDTYTVTLMNGNFTVDTVSASLTGKTRPSFSLVHNGYGPATLQEALNSEWHESGISYPNYQYTLNSGYVQTVMSGEYEHLEGALRWTALVIKDSSGNVANLFISGLGVENDSFELSQSGILWDFVFEGDNDNVLDVGTYTVALYTADGYTYSQMDEMRWDLYDEDKPQARTRLANIFSSGRRISSNVSLTVTEDVYMGYGSAYESSNAIIDDRMVTRYFRCSYEPPAEGTEGFITVVPASNTSQRLNTVSLGTEETWGMDVSRFSYNTLDPVYVIIYYGSFEPSHFLYVMYLTAD